MCYNDTHENETKGNKKKIKIIPPEAGAGFSPRPQNRGVKEKKKGDAMKTTDLVNRMQMSAGDDFSCLIEKHVRRVEVITKITISNDGVYNAAEMEVVNDLIEGGVTAKITVDGVTYGDETTEIGVMALTDKIKNYFVNKQQ